MNKSYMLACLGFALVAAYQPAAGQQPRKWNVVECTGTTTLDVGGRVRDAGFNAVFSIDEQDAIIDHGNKETYGNTFTRDSSTGSSAVREYKGPPGEGVVRLRVFVETGQIELHRMMVVGTGLAVARTSASCKKFVPSSAFK